MFYVWNMTIQALDGRDIPMWTQGDKLRKAREHAGFDQSSLARRLGVARNTISNAERGAVEPRTAVVMAWAMATNVSLDWLQGNENPRPEGPDGGERLPRLDLNQQPFDYAEAQVTDLSDYRSRVAWAA